jgi:DNA-binding NarL/FixJ family response regulator
MESKLNGTPPLNACRPNQKTARVIFVEKRTLIRGLLSRAIAGSGRFEVLAAQTVEEGMELVNTRDGIAVVLLSITCDLNSDGTQEMWRCATDSGIPIVVLCDGEKPSHVVSALQAGASGYISTNMSLDVTLGALQLVQAGGQFIPAGCITELRYSSAAPIHGVPSPLCGMFTARQAAVIAALRQGKQNKIIAYELNMRESTVKVHVRNIMKKLNATNRTEVAYLTNQLLAAAT